MYHFADYAEKIKWQPCKYGAIAYILLNIEIFIFFRQFLFKFFCTVTNMIPYTSRHPLRV